MSTMISSCTQPKLPLELERDIFELTARTHRQSAVKLTLVARRVQIWIEKLIYEVVSLTTPKKCTNFLRTLAARPPHFFLAHVRALCLPYHLDTIQASHILSVCASVDNLGCWTQRGPSALYTGLSPLPRPRRLSVNMRDLFHSTPPDFHIPLFTNITHLRVVDPWTSWVSWASPSTPGGDGSGTTSPSAFHNLPHLTHLALDFSGVSEVHLPRIGPVLEGILRTCERLEVCLLQANAFELSATRRALDGRGLVDPRVMLLAYANPVDGWEASVRGEGRWEGVV